MNEIDAYCHAGKFGSVSILMEIYGEKSGGICNWELLAIVDFDILLLFFMLNM